MIKKSTKPSLSLSAPKLTLAGWWALCVRLIFPFIGVLLALDIVLYALFRFGFGRCYGVMCWL